MNYLFSILFSLFMHPNEINIANSVDWMCYKSDLVALVKITSYKEEKFTLMSYESNGSVNATIITTYKGRQPLLKEITIYSKLAYIGGDHLKKMVGKEVVVFLQLLACEESCAYAIWDLDRGMIDPASSADKALTGDFKSLKNLIEMEDYINACTKKLEGKTSKGYYLEVPFDTEAHAALYAGSSCFLIVPDILYPKAKKSMMD